MGNIKHSGGKGVGKSHSTHLAEARELLKLGEKPGVNQVIPGFMKLNGKSSSFHGIKINVLRSAAIKLTLIIGHQSQEFTIQVSDMHQALVSLMTLIEKEKSKSLKGFRTLNVAFEHPTQGLIPQSSFSLDVDLVECAKALHLTGAP